MRWTHDIGNLTLTYDNSSLATKPFAEKRGHPGLPRCYASSPFFVERQIASYDRWTEVEIIDRRQKIMEWALQRWAIDETVVIVEVKCEAE